MTRTATGRRGGVASGHPLAADAGLRVLDDGGSAVDAALTMAITQWVVNSPMCGPGGELFVMHVVDGRAMVYGGWSRTPTRFPVDGPVTPRGPTAAVVPGALRGVEAAWNAAGRLPWRRLFDDALKHSHGHLVTESMERSYRSVVERGKADALHAVIDQEATPTTGTNVSCERLGRTLSLLAERGADEFYDGALAVAIIAAAQADGAYLKPADLHSMDAQIAEAMMTEIDGLTIAVPPPPSQSCLTAEILAASPASAPPTSVEFVNAVAPLTRDRLIEKCIVGLEGTAASIAADDTSAAVVVHSLAGVQYGSGWVAGDTGIALGNRVGANLSTRPDLPASNPFPGGVLVHTLSAAWFRAGDRSLLIATPGGDRQVQWLAQAGQRFRHGATIDDIVTGPRWFVCPEGDRFGVPGGIGKEWYLFAEPDVEWANQTSVASFAVQRVDTVGGGLQGVTFEPDGQRHFGADPRSGGSALSQGGT
ncbi:gamma-glutamyltransferase [Gemmatimonas sp.]|uniref:gamma-glutamyltransferase n=1 Tax=Gemmatimonas sp. TaxID=1962908 RepID=UPI00356B21EC